MTPTERAETLKYILIGYAIDGDEASRGVLADFIKEQFGGHEHAAGILLYLPHGFLFFTDAVSRNRWQVDGVFCLPITWDAYVASKIWYLLDQDLILPFSSEWFEVTA